jgi:hypothetical protein
MSKTRRFNWIRSGVLIAAFSLGSIGLVNDAYAIFCNNTQCNAGTPKCVWGAPGTCTTLDCDATSWYTCISCSCVNTPIGQPVCKCI